MTKIWVLSDTHYDHGGLRLKPPADADIAVIAGDAQDDAWLAELADQLPVVYVAGNHDYYGHAFDERLAALRAMPNLWFLENSSAIISGVIFIGATLWTDYGRSPVAAEAARRGMNDHRLISWTRNPWQRFLPSHATQMHEKSVSYLGAEFGHEATAPVVVVTHHAPSERSVHPKYAGKIINRAYYSDLDDLVGASGAAVWVHGHVHSNFSYEIGGTRVICNPHGYPGENPEFNPALVVEV